ncbi:MAG TPA: hypothetical protein DDZ04_03505 [Parabacteroides sp.]|nr:hypothetical protein [Parabacteroides sp.]
MQYSQNFPISANKKRGKLADKGKSERLLFQKDTAFPKKGCGLLLKGMRPFLKDPASFVSAHNHCGHTKPKRLSCKTSVQPNLFSN